MPRLPHRKHPAHIEAKMNPSIEPVAAGFGNVAFFDHGGTVGEMKLEDVAAGFDVEAEAEVVAVAIVKGQGYGKPVRWQVSPKEAIETYDVKIFFEIANLLLKIFLADETEIQIGPPHPVNAMIDQNPSSWPVF